MSKTDNSNRLMENLDMLGALAGLFITAIVWTIMVRWNQNRDTLLTNNESFKLLLGILILIPIFVFGAYIFVKGVWAILWEVVAKRAQTT